MLTFAVPKKNNNCINLNIFIWFYNSGMVHFWHTKLTNVLPSVNFHYLCADFRQKYPCKCVHTSKEYQGHDSPFSPKLSSWPLELSLDHLHDYVGSTRTHKGVGWQVLRCSVADWEPFLNPQAKWPKCKHDYYSW